MKNEAIAKANNVTVKDVEYAREVKDFGIIGIGVTTIIDGEE